ncbi:hypothetical protein ACEQPO_18920 [Bacillus sp. SL00103]
MLEESTGHMTVHTDHRDGQINYEPPFYWHWLEKKLVEFRSRGN